MKKISKILMMLAVFTFVSTTLFAGGAKESASKKKSTIELTKEEKEAGWQYLRPIGFKVNKKEWSTKYDNNRDQGDSKGDENYDEVLYLSYQYGFASNELVAEYNKVVADKNLTREQKIKKINTELNPQILPVYAFIVLNTPLINKDLKDITGFPVNKVIRKNKKYTQIFAVSEPTKKGLSEESAAIYKAMIEDAYKIKNTITCVDPVSPTRSLMAMKGLKFETVDLEGKPVTSDILKDYDVTMINIWATWCPPCKAELPEIAKLYENFKDKKCNVIGLTWNLVKGDEKTLGTAKNLIENAGCKYTIIKNNANLKGLFGKNLQGLPTTIFVDKNGDVIATSKKDIIVGAKDLKAFSKAMERALETVSK